MNDGQRGFELDRRPAEAAHGGHLRPSAGAGIWRSIAKARLKSASALSGPWPHVPVRPPGHPGTPLLGMMRYAANARLHLRKSPTSEKSVDNAPGATFRTHVLQVISKNLYGPL
jgi:hypothetical protein